MANNTDIMLEIFLPGIASHVEEPETKLPFHQIIKIFGSEFEKIQRQLIRINLWNADNLSGEHWYIAADKVIFSNSMVTFAYNFSTEEDLMAFKLRWV